MLATSNLKNQDELPVEMVRAGATVDAYRIKSKQALAGQKKAKKKALDEQPVNLHLAVEARDMLARMEPIISGTAEESPGASLCSLHVARVNCA
jgi:hypothetical protein